MEKNRLKKLGRNLVKVARSKGGEGILNGIERNSEAILQIAHSYRNSKGLDMTIIVVDVTGYGDGQAMRLFSNVMRCEEGISYTKCQDYLDGHDYIYALLERSQRDSGRSDREETPEMLGVEATSEYRLEDDGEFKEMIQKAILESIRATEEM